MPVVLRPGGHHRVPRARRRLAPERARALLRHHRVRVVRADHGGDRQSRRGAHAQGRGQPREHPGVPGDDVPGVHLRHHRVHLEIRHAAGGDDGRGVLRRRRQRHGPAAAELPGRVRRVRVPGDDPAGHRVRVGGRVRRRDLAPVVRHVRRLRRRQRRFVRGAGRRARRRGGVRGAHVLRDDHAERGGRRVPVLRHGQGPEPGPPPRVPRRVRGGEPESRAARRRRAESQR